MGAFDLDVGLIGGAGRVGLPLALLFADSGLRTTILDVATAKVDAILRGCMPFREEGADAMLSRVLARGTLAATTDPSALARCKFVVCIIGTPVDEHMNPSFDGILRVLREYRDKFRSGQTVVLRSTVFPGSSARIQRFFQEEGLEVGVAFCPERVAQGVSLRECRELPQIISAFDAATLQQVRSLFSVFASEFVELDPMEAELCKLMTNSWRYLQFAAINQFYMIARENGVDFDRILHGCRYKYPRTASMPGPGFAAGPCLVKDTMQLAAFSHNSFALGHAAMLVNEGLPAFLVDQARREVDLSRVTAGVLGLAFKGDSDDKRDSLAYKLIKLLQFVTARVLRTDPLVRDPEVRPLDEVLAQSDVIFVTAPHEAYRTLRVPAGKRVYDPWSCLPRNDQP